MSVPAVLPARPGACVRASLSAVLPPRHGGPGDPAGAPGERDRRGVAVQHGSRNQAIRPGGPRGRPRPAARRERRPRGEAGGPRSVRSRPGAGHRRRLRRAQLGDALRAGRPGRAGRGEGGCGRRTVAPEPGDGIALVAGTVRTDRAPFPVERPIGRADVSRHRGRQRRPTGAPPPLPRSVGRSGRIWLAAMAYVFIASVVAFRIAGWERFANHNDTWILARLTAIRTPWLTHLARAVKVFGSGWPISIIGLGLVALLMTFRRWRHLLVFLASLFLLLQIGNILYMLVSRPRPYGVRIIGGWGGFSLPSPPIAIFAMTVLGILYTLIPHGRLRDRAKWWAASAILVLAVARIYLAVDHPSDVVFGIVLCVAISVTMFRVFTPWEVFPVVYRKGSTAHLDVTGRRGEAIRQAARDQLGLRIAEIKPFGLE